MINYAYPAITKALIRKCTARRELWGFSKKLCMLMWPYANRCKRSTLPLHRTRNAVAADGKSQ